MEKRPASPYRPKHELVVDEFKDFRDIMKALIAWQENGVTPDEYVVDTSNFTAQDEQELKRYLRADPSRTEGSLTQDMYVRLRDRALKMGMWPEKVRISKDGCKVILAPSSGEKRRKRDKWTYTRIKGSSFAKKWHKNR